MQGEIIKLIVPCALPGNLKKQKYMTIKDFVGPGGVLGASLGLRWGVLEATWGASCGLLGRLGGLLGGGLGSPGGLGGLLEGFWEGPGVVSEVPGGTPDIGSRSGIAQGSLKDRSRIAQV